MNHAATTTTPSKPEKTDFIAFCGWGWGFAPCATDAIRQMLRHVPSSGLERFRSERKKVEVRVFECSEDWKVYDSGSVSAKYVAEYATAELDPALALKAKDVEADLEEALNYKD
jgi:hypothetical protein